LPARGRNSIIGRRVHRVGGRTPHKTGVALGAFAKRE
jgi:hypothetical protein